MTHPRSVSTRVVNTTEPVIQGIDHLIVMSADLDRSETRWRSLGFATTPRGFHDSGGTANHLIILQRTYLELLGLVTPGQESPYRALMSGTPGLWGIALKGSADAAYRLWSSLGLEVAAPANLSRPVLIGGRSERAQFRITMLARAPGLPFPLFCCEHLTPQFVWEPGRATHPNGATSLREVILTAGSAPLRRQLERIFDIAPAPGDSRTNTILTGETRITFLDEGDFRRRFGQVAAPPTGAGPPIAAISLESVNLAAARAAAQAAGNAVTATEGDGFIEALADEGVVLEWVPARIRNRE